MANFYDIYDNTISKLDSTWAYWSLASSYFTVLTWTGFYDNSGNVLHSISNPSTSDTWRKVLSTNMYSGSNKTKLTGVKKGYLPCFNGNTPLITITAGTNVDISRTDSKLTIGSSSFSTSNFRDGAIPHVLIFQIQGGGGGGGGTTASNDGTGGGAGGFVSLIYNLDRDIIAYAGHGGAGGYKKQINGSVDGGGLAGDNSTIFDSATGDTIAKAIGGGYGRASTKSQSYTGGRGGSASASMGWCKYTKTGGNGGKVYSLSNATGCSALTVYATANTSTSLTQLKQSLSTKLGGAQGHNKAPGGGGGSMLASGPAGAASTSDGKAGSNGAGGSGARYTLAVYKRGGKGGDGLIRIYY